MFAKTYSAQLYKEITFFHKIQLYIGTVLNKAAEISQDSPY